MKRSRRDFILLSGVSAAGSLAGCTSPSQSGPDGTTGGTTSTDTETTITTTGTGGTPGRDVLGGPDDLASDPTVRATVLDEDQGAGKFVNTPAAAWVEEGATVTWQIEGAGHSVTAYHPDNGTNLRIPDGASAFDSGILSAGETFEHTFDAPGVYDYFCEPHEGLGMVGVVVVGGPRGGPGTTAPDLEQSAANQALQALLDTAGLLQAGGGESSASYDFTAATNDTYWYSLYNMSTNVAMSANGVQFPHDDEQREAFEKRLPAMLKHADVDRPPIRNPNLNMAPFTEGAPSFTQRPVFDAGDGRPDAATLTWDPAESSKVVSPASVAWTHLKGVTWAKNFQNHFDVLPTSLAPKFRAQMLATLAQIGTNATLIAGGADGSGVLTKGDSMELVSGFAPGEGEVVDATTRLRHHTAMLWFLSDLNSLAQNGWFGYVNPEPLIPAGKVQQLTDAMGKTTMDLFPAESVVSRANARQAGLLLGGLGWFGTHAGSDALRSRAADYADALADQVASNVDGNGKVAGGVANQAATQGAVGQGLAWVSRVDGVDRTDLAASVLGWLNDELWDPDAGLYASRSGATTHTWTARDAGDLTGGVNAADAVVGVDGVRERFARTFDELFNRGRLQRAERPPSRDAESGNPLPLPPKAGGDFGQAAVYNAEVEYDPDGDEWTVTDDRFRTADALYLANQDVWMSHWGGEFFQGRGVPGQNDEPA